MAHGAGGVALVLIDCQQAFVRGCWMAGVGKADVEPILAVYDRIASFLPTVSADTRVLVTQCPFPTASDFELYPPVRDALLSWSSSRGASVKRVVKPGNSVLRASGAIQWFDEAVADGVRTVVIAGCTLTSCVRVSATDVHRRYGSSYGLRTCVDLSLCGARASNYVKRCDSCLQSYLTGYCSSSHSANCKCGDESQTAMKSPVDRTVADMKSVGIGVLDSFDWSSRDVS